MKPFADTRLKRLDEWTESAIRDVLNAGLTHGPADKLSPDNCELCRDPLNALRVRILELQEIARKEGREDAWGVGI